MQQKIPASAGLFYIGIALVLVLPWMSGVRLLLVLGVEFVVEVYEVVVEIVSEIVVVIFVVEIVVIIEPVVVEIFIVQIVELVLYVGVLVIFQIVLEVLVLGVRIRCFFRQPRSFFFLLQETSPGLQPGAHYRDLLVLDRSAFPLRLA